MVAIMIGSSLFKICVMKLAITPEVLARYIFGVAALSLFIPTTTTVYFFSFSILPIVSSILVF